MSTNKYSCPKIVRKFTPVGLSLFFLIVAGCSQEPAGAPKAPPSAAVAVTTVTSQTVPIYGEYVARTEARQEVEVRARVGGYLEKILFKEGSQVRAGQLLFVIDQRPYKAALQEAKGSLAQAQASLWKARQDVERLQPLVAEDAAPQVDLDNAKAAVKYSQASIDKAKGAIAQAELNLKFSEIRSPITGIVGKEEVAAGNLITRDQTLLATISSWDPMRVVFSISEADYLLWAKKFGESAPFIPEKHIEPFELVLSNNSVYPFRGRLNFVDRALNLSTGTLNVYVNFPNPNRLLRPGLFGRVRVVLEQRPNTLLVPQRAVQVMQGVQSVLVVGPENKVSLRTVTLGERYKGFFIVKEGLKPGDRVVVEGLQIAIPGRQVTPTEHPSSQEESGG
ncbi:MAG: efflux RND transporter periplasmic adaptor subunit [Thermodesulfobacteriota bacterium]